MTSTFSITDGRSPLPLRSLEDDRASLERRLAEGYEKIEEAIAKGQDVASWERFWIELLHEYEEICNRLRAAA